MASWLCIGKGHPTRPSGNCCQSALLLFPLKCVKSKAMSCFPLPEEQLKSEKLRLRRGPDGRDRELHSGLVLKDSWMKPSCASNGATNSLTFWPTLWNAETVEGSVEGVSRWTIGEGRLRAPTRLPEALFVVATVQCAAFVELPRTADTVTGVKLVVIVRTSESWFWTKIWKEI